MSLRTRMRSSGVAISPSTTHGPRTAHDEIVRLTPTEFRLLEQLAVSAGKVLTHTELLTQVWGPEYHDDRDYLWV